MPLYAVAPWFPGAPGNREDAQVSGLRWFAVGVQSRCQAASSPKLLGAGCSSAGSGWYLLLSEENLFLSPQKAERSTKWLRLEQH